MIEPVEAIAYPASDGTPMGENDVIVWLMACALATLRRWFEGDPQAYVSSNSFVYFEERKPKRRVAPDLYFVRGVENRPRRNFKIWEEGVPPLVVFEFTTADSARRDLGKKKWLYRRLGVQEYYLFDPEGEYLRPRFRAFRLLGRRYREIPAADSVYSPGLGLDVLVRGQLLGFRDPKTGAMLTTPEDVSHLEGEIRRMRRRLARAVKMAARADELAARVRELEAEVTRLRSEGAGEG